MTLREAIEKQRAKYGFTAKLEADVTELTPDPLSNILTKEELAFLNEEYPKALAYLQQRPKPDVAAAVEKQRREFGFSPRRD